MSELAKWIVTLFTSTMENFIGGFDSLIKAMLIFILVDYITEVACVIQKKSSSSRIGINEITKKVFMLILVGIANTIDINITNTPGVLRTIVILFYVSYIGKSILKNAKLLGVIIPSKLKTEIKELGNDEDDNMESS